MTPEYRELQQRLAKLEKQNRTFRRTAIALLVAVGAVLLMGQAAPKHRVIEAEKFVLTDAAGRMRANLSTNEGRTMLMLYALHGDSGLQLSVDDKDNPVIMFHGKKGEPNAALGSEFIAFTTDMTHGAFLSYTKENGPRLALDDDQGYSARLSSGKLVTPKTGETHQTSAASLILFDNDESVIWKAP